MAPHWFELLAWAALGLGFASALVIAADIFLLGNRQHMAIMNLVFPLTALYMGPVALWLYLSRGRRMSHKQMHAKPMMEREARDSWWQVAWMIGATAELGPEYILDLPLAWIFGILFQYFAIAPLRGQVGELAPLWDAIKSDTLSVLSFEVGLFGWMAIVHYVIWQPPLPIDSSSYWFMMQIGMILGFLTSWPVNRWLLRKGVKEPMLMAGHPRLASSRHLGEPESARAVGSAEGLSES
jgi:hypothetical protein